MGETGQARGLSDAAGGRAAGRLAARRPLGGLLKRFWRDDSGATAVELGVIVVMVVVVLAVGLTAISDGVNKAFSKASSAVGT